MRYNNHLNWLSEVLIRTFSMVGRVLFQLPLDAYFALFNKPNKRNSLFISLTPPINVAQVLNNSEMLRHHHNSGLMPCGVAHSNCLILIKIVVPIEFHSEFCTFTKLLSFGWHFYDYDCRLSGESGDNRAASDFGALQIAHSRPFQFVSGKWLLLYLSLHWDSL